MGTFIANIKDPSGRYGTTVISYDKGGNWGSLRPPSVDRNGFFINCQPVLFARPALTLLALVVCMCVCATARVFSAPAHPGRQVKWLPVHPDSGLCHRPGHGFWQPWQCPGQQCLTSELQPLHATSLACPLKMSCAVDTCALTCSCVCTSLVMAASLGLR